MDDLLQPVKTVRNVRSNIAKFETLASQETEVKRDSLSSRKTKVTNGVGSQLQVSHDLGETEKPVTGDDKHDEREQLSLGDTAQKDQKNEDVSKPNLAAVQSPEEALQVLADQGHEEQFEAATRYLTNGIKGKHGFNVQIPDAIASPIVNALATTVIPDRWHVLNSPGASRSDKYAKKSLLSCMNSLAGIGALVARLQSLMASSQIRRTESSQYLAFQDTASFFASMMYPKSFVQDLLPHVQAYSQKPIQRQALWAETISLLAGSKILNVFQEASAIPELRDAIPCWLQDPREYSQWLGANLASAAINTVATDTEAWSMLATFLKRALSLGHKGRYTSIFTSRYDRRMTLADALVSEMYTRLLFGQKALWTTLQLLSRSLPRLDQRMILELMLLDMSKKYLATRSDGGVNSNLFSQGKAAVGGVAAILAGFVQNDEYLEMQLVDWLTASSSSSAAISLQARRAMILVLSSKEEKLRILLEKSMKMFSDKLHIKHDPLLQQESLAQVILLTAGYLRRVKSQYMVELSKSSSYLHAVSNRLAASLPKARFLGMVVGMVISRLVDPPGKVMKFDLDDTESDEVEWWHRLVEVEDEIGSVEDLTRPSGTHGHVQMILRQNKITRPAAKSEPPRVTSKVVSIEEIQEDSDTKEVEAEAEEEEEEDDLIPYQKPDEDPDDSDEDPTLINRDKPRAPVYLIELIKCLNVSDKPEVVQIGLKTAPSLIRRKANFGTEGSENIEAVANSLINLQDGMSEPELQELRLQSLMACLVSKPMAVGPWLARMFFEGDFSLFQRSSILATIGLSSRELAGEDEDKESNRSLAHPTPPPSNQLPPHLAALYGRINTATNRIQHNTLQPMALAAADEATGPAILKIRTFSSRLEVEKKTTARALARTKRIPKNLHKILAEGLYLPLCCRMSILLSNPNPSSNPYQSYHHPSQPTIATRSTTISSSSSSLFDPPTLKLFLQTLTILLTTLGPNAIPLPTVTRETVLLLTVLHHTRRLSLDAAVLPAMLTLLLTVLDINVAAGPVAEEQLVRDLGAEVVELVGWVGVLVDGGGGSGEEGVRVPVEEDNGIGMAGRGPMPWTVVAAGIMVKWSEISRKFQARLMGMVGGGGI